MEVCSIGFDVLIFPNCSSICAEPEKFYKPEGKIFYFVIHLLELWALTHTTSCPIAERRDEVGTG